MKTKAELTFPGELKNEAIICQLCKQFDIVVNILEASFSTNLGWAILIIDGSKEEKKKAFDYLRNKGVEIEKLQETT